MKEAEREAGEAVGETPTVTPFWLTGESELSAGIRRQQQQQHEASQVALDQLKRAFVVTVVPTPCITFGQNFVSNELSVTSPPSSLSSGESTPGYSVKQLPLRLFSLLAAQLHNFYFFFFFFLLCESRDLSSLRVRWEREKTLPQGCTISRIEKDACSIV